MTRSPAGRLRALHCSKAPFPHRLRLPQLPRRPGCDPIAPPG